MLDQNTGNTRGPYTRAGLVRLGPQLRTYPRRRLRPCDSSRGGGCGRNRAATGMLEAQQRE